MGGFVYRYEENTKCINLSIYLHVFLKGSLPEIYPLGKMLLVAGRHQLLYIKNKEKRKKRKMFLKRSYIFCYFCCFIFLNYVLNLFSLGPSIKIAAASFLYGLFDKRESVHSKEGDSGPERYSTAGRAFAFHTANPGLISGIPGGPQPSLGAQSQE